MPDSVSRVLRDLALTPYEHSTQHNDPEADTDVTGYFQLSDLAQFTALRTFLPELQSEPGTQVIHRLRSDGLRWHIGSLKKWRAQRYQREAGEYGLQFIIVG